MIHWFIIFIMPLLVAWPTTMSNQNIFINANSWCRHKNIKFYYWYIAHLRIKLCSLWRMDFLCSVLEIYLLPVLYFFLGPNVCVLFIFRIHFQTQPRQMDYCNKSGEPERRAAILPANFYPQPCALNAYWLFLFSFHW